MGKNEAVTTAPVYPNRIRELRKERGLKMREVAERAGYTASFISRLETGERQLTLENIDRISAALGVAPEEILPGSTPRLVPLVGYVGAGAQTVAYGEGQGELDYVPAMSGSGLDQVAVRVHGESLGPLFNGWLVFYDERHDPPSENMLGRLCVVGLPDGRVLVKTMQRGNLPGHYTLLSQFEPPIYDVLVDWAAVVTGMRPQ